ncbi:glial cell line-derived neurotrophic factor isoform X1 [Oryzias latipes]|uniref:Glial cell line-derived neurotrophic factor n=2 Tax=Oryzias latipes TaxID=8090 RepID=H2LUT4_ORYLA|nr:glial cell line-derived neurotrophic factor isoform X1 [Oryzias latipes]XP_023816697.1 glial cell line-derived neurotrophic factor isoform X1 [Oryzias latipes]
MNWAFFIGTESKMKLWDVLATCLLLLSSVATRPLYQSTHPAKRTYFPSSSHPASLSVEDEEPLFQRKERKLKDISMEDQYDAAGFYPEQFEDVMDFIEATISRLRRSSEPAIGSRGRREQKQRKAANTGGRREEGRGHGVKRKSRGRGGGRGSKGGRGDKGKEGIYVQSRGCLLKEVHLNVTDLGLGYQTKEELIFRYCSGPCAEAETNYDKILNNLTHNKKLDKDTPSRTCCRPIAFDDDLSFLDDNVVYHTLKKHSARKCGCV